MKRVHVIGSIAAMTLILALAGCQMFEDSPTEVAAPGDGANVLSDFLMGAPELDTWGAYYVKGGSFVRLDIPKSGAVKVEYSTVSGWKGAIFLETSKAVGLEIGIKEDDVVDWVCVTYAEGETFAAVPADAVADVKADKGWTHYKQDLGDDGLRHWWPTNAAFAFSGGTMSACGVVDSEVQWEVIPGGAFEKPIPSSPCAEHGAAEYDGSCWVLPINDQTGQEACAAHGLSYDTSKVGVFKTIGESAAQTYCTNVLDLLGAAGTGLADYNDASTGDDCWANHSDGLRYYDIGTDPTAQWWIYDNSFADGDQPAPCALP